MNSDKIGVINGLRGLAILVVIYQHSLFGWLQKNFDFQYILGNGWLGVNLFFILSGFVLYKPYCLNQRCFKTKDDWLIFYVHRIKRLYPLFLFSLLIALFIKGFEWENIKSALLTVSTLSMFTVDNFVPVINPVLWSLVVEIWFSVLFPVLILFFNKYGVRNVFIFILILSLIARFPGSMLESLDIHLNPIKDNFITRLDDFVLGIFICHHYYKAQFEKIEIGIHYFLLSTVLLVLGSLLWDLRVYHNLPHAIVPFINNVIQLGFYFMILYSLSKDSVFNYIFSFKGLQIFGLMCFSLYVWHVLFIELFLYPHSISNFIFYYLITFFFSALTYRFVEFRKQPFKKLFLLTDK